MKRLSSPVTHARPLCFSFRCARLLLLFFALTTSTDLWAQKKKSAHAGSEYIVLKTYHATAAGQLATIDQYLQASLVPALEKKGFRKVGVFSAISNDTAADKKIVLLIPIDGIAKLDQLALLSDQLQQDSITSKDYTKAAYNQPAFGRVETVLLRAFSGMPKVKASPLTGSRDERVYELRSYESATEGLHLNKVKMFNQGEVELFDRLGFNAVFYGQVLAGSRMPNLMYMTSFESKASRDEHWKTFGSDPEWKKMSSLPEYKNNVSKIDITFLRPMPYSKL